MDSKINVQPPFLYSIWLPVILFLLLIIVSILIVIFKLRKKKPVEVKPVQQMPVETVRHDISGVKGKYLGLLDKLSLHYKEGKITNKDAYQKLSVIIRDFVLDMSGIDLTKSTLSQIKEKNIPIVSELIGYYYLPEFAYGTNEDPIPAINDAKKVIGKWS